MTTTSRNRLQGVDPYGVWAEMSEFKGYDRGPEPYAYQVVVVAPCTQQPWDVDPNEQDPKFKEKRLICTFDEGDEKRSVWTGTVRRGIYQSLLLKNDIYLELNVPRNHLMFAGGSDLQTAPLVHDLTDHVIAVIDHGCPFGHKQFLIGKKRSWESRVRYLWDQGQEPELSEGWFPVKFDNAISYGREMTTGTSSKPGWSMNKQIREATDKTGLLDEDLLYKNVNYDAMAVRKTHGAHVLDLAAGAINPMTGQRDGASEADIIFVQLPRSTVADTSGGSMTKYVLDALKYIFARAAQAQHLVINMSYGSTAGPHDGSSLLEKSIDKLIQQERKKRKHLEIVLPAGNHFLAQGHTEVVLSSDVPTKQIHWHVMPDNQTDTFLELWYETENGASVEITVDCPDGTKVGPVSLGEDKQIKSLKQGRKRKLIGGVIHAKQVLNNAKAMILIAVGPTHAEPTGQRSPAPHGFWKVTVGLSKSAPRFSGKVVVQAWVERDDPLPGQAGQPQSYLLANRLNRNQDSEDLPTDRVRRRSTGNSLANGVEPVVVGACVNANARVSDYSAAGPTLNTARNAGRSWPDCIAPGDETDALDGIQAAGTRSGVLVRMNGSSVAAPQVARKMINAWKAGIETPFPKPPTVNSTCPMPKQRSGEFAQTYPHLKWVP